MHKLYLHINKTFFDKLSLKENRVKIVEGWKENFGDFSFYSLRNVTLRGKKIQKSYST